MKFARFVFLISLMVFGRWSQAQDAALHQNAAPVPVKFEDLGALIQKNNESLKAARVNVESQQERTGHLGRSFLPRLSAASGSESFREGSSTAENKGYWSVGASINLYRGSKDAQEESIRQETLSAARLDSGLIYQQELRDARLAFWQGLTYQKLIALKLDELKKNDENLQSARRRSGAGVATNADALQFELNRTLLEQSIRALELKLDLARNRLATLLGLDSHEGLVFAGEFSLNEQPVLVSKNTQNNLEVQNLKSAQKIESLRADQASTWWRPKLDVYAKHGVPSLSDEYARALNSQTETYAGIVVSLDLGEGLDGFSEARSKRLAAKAAEFRTSKKIREVKALDQEIRHDLELTSVMIKENEKSLSKAREFLRLTQSEYARGIKNGPDLMSASKQLFEFQERFLELQRDLAMGRAALENLLAAEESSR